MPAVVNTTITPLGANAGKFTLQLHVANDSWIPSLQNVPDVWARLGQAGSGSQNTGTRGRNIQPSGQRWESSASARDTFIANFEAIENEVCSVQDSWGRTLARVRLTNCRANPVNTRGPIISGTTPCIYRIECTWTAERLPDG